MTPAEPGLPGRPAPGRGVLHEQRHAHGAGVVARVVVVFPDNELAALFRQLASAMDARTMGSSPRHTCASATSTFLEMLSNDFVRKCEGLTPAAPPEKMPAPRAAATAAVGDAVAVVDAGDSGGFQFGFSVELVWLVRLGASAPSCGAVAASSMGRARPTDY